MPEVNYKVFRPLSIEEMENTLNQYHSDGWELAANVISVGNEFVVVLRRSALSALFGDDEEFDSEIEE